MKSTLLTNYQNSLSQTKKLISPLIPNSKLQYTKYFSEIQASNLANQLPIFDFKNEELSKLFFKFLKQNKFLWKYQILEKKIFEEGKYALGLEYIKEEEYKYTPLIKMAKVINYEYQNFKLTKLKIQIDNYTFNNLNYSIFEEFNLTSKENYVKAYACENITKKITKLNDIQYSYNLKPNRYDNFIPWVIFQNRPDEKSDIELVNDELFLSLDHSLDCYWRDTYFSSPYIFISSTLGGSNIEQKLKNSIYDLNQRIFTLNNFNEMFEADSPVKMIQAQSQGQILIQKINEDMARIEKFIFAKKDTKNFGTKNLQTAEVEQVNSDFEDYYEYKANLREDNFKDFVLLWQKILKNHNVVVDFDINDIKIIVASSTQWLQEQSYKYSYNQNGINIKTKLVNDEDNLNGNNKN